MSGKASTNRRKCAICGKPAEEAFKPFCSVRCADVDLNRWLGGVYRIPTDEAPTGAPDTAGTVPPRDIAEE